MFLEARVGNKDQRVLRSVMSLQLEIEVSHEESAVGDRHGSLQKQPHLTGAIKGNNIFPNQIESDAFSWA